MIRPRRTTKDIELLKLQLADIIEDEFTRHQVISHERLAQRHMLRNSSTTALEDVAAYGDAAVVYLRDNRLAIVPITGQLPAWQADSDNEEKIKNAVAGVGAGGPRVGWYKPVDRDDWLWVYYISHLARSGVAAVFHAGKQVEDNKHLNSSTTRAKIAARATGGLPLPPGLAETRVLAERVKP